MNRLLKIPSHITNVFIFSSRNQPGWSACWVILVCMFVGATTRWQVSLIGSGIRIQSTAFLAGKVIIVDKMEQR